MKITVTVTTITAKAIKPFIRYFLMVFLGFDFFLYSRFWVVFVRYEKLNIGNRVM